MIRVSLASLVWAAFCFPVAAGEAPDKQAVKKLAHLLGAATL